MSKASSAKAAYQLRVWLRGISPTIWRRFVVRGDSTIADLHYILQLVMGWTDTHLHTFVLRMVRRGHGTGQNQIVRHGGRHMSLIPIEALVFALAPMPPLRVLN